MKKMLLILGLVVMTVNVYAENRSKVLESVNKERLNVKNGGIKIP